jgi:hypothetical protein
MTIFMTTCVAIAITRCLEEFFRFCINLISNLTSKKKSREVTVSEYKRLVATVTPEIYEVIKAHCTSTGLTVTQFTLSSVIEKLKREGVM